MPKLMIANWKMNFTAPQAREFIQNLKANLPTSFLNSPTNSQAIICAPFTALAALRPELKGTTISLGAQNMYHEENGAFTGEISATMLSDLGVEYVIVGHSERRRLFHETNHDVAQKVAQCFSHHLTPIICLDEPYIDEQKQALLDINAADFSRAVFAFEPVSAIGTGQPMHPTTAAPVIERIHQTFGPNLGVLYGGSVNADNVTSFTAVCDGCLIGGASLKVDEYSKMLVL